MCSSPWAFSTVSNPRLSAKTAFVTHTLLFSLVGVSGISPALKKLLWAPYSEPKLERFCCPTLPEELGSCL